MLYCYHNVLRSGTKSREPSHKSYSEAGHVSRVTSKNHRRVWDYDLMHIECVIQSFRTVGANVAL